MSSVGSGAGPDQVAPKPPVIALMNAACCACIASKPGSLASGVCENCASPAPFSSSGGVPFLEVHHVRTLAAGGSDTIENAVALCPKCHREFHYGANSAALVSAIYVKCARLIKE